MAVWGEVVHEKIIAITRTGHEDDWVCLSFKCLPKNHCTHFLCGLSSRVKLVNYISGTETFGSDKSQVLTMVLSYVRVVWRISLS